MAAGYLYVLVNSSMPGLVKVGKTVRDPAQRADELSGVTGVATPFVLAFEQQFPDCDLAEAHVHSSLERLGYREAKNREFFRAPASDVVKTILALDSVLREQATFAIQSGSKDDENDSDLLPNRIEDDDLVLDDIKSSPPWAGILEQAEALFYGLGDTLEDPEEALGYYKDAARLGSLLAYQRIGSIYADTRNDLGRALEFFKEGFRRGNYYCMAEMAAIFELRDQLDNANKCWKKFFESRRLSILEEIEDPENVFMMNCCSYLFYCARHQVKIDFISDVLPLIDQIIEYLETSRADETKNDVWRAACFRTVELVRLELRRPTSSFDSSGLRADRNSKWRS